MSESTVKVHTGQNFNDIAKFIKELTKLPIAMGKTILKDNLKAFAKQAKYINPMLDALTDDANLLDIVPVIEQSFADSVSDTKRLIKNLKKDIREKGPEFRSMKKKDNKDSRKNPGPTGKRKIGTGSIANTNHPEWYMQDKTMLPSLVGINVSVRQNASLERVRNVVTSTGGAPYVATLSVPSICGIKLELTMPKSITNDWQQAINMLYKNIRSANAGAINYSPAQLANYVFSIRSIDAALSTLYKAISVLNSGTFYDAMSPQSYFKAIGLDYASFSSNAANARELYNRLSALRYRLMPLNVTLLDRTRWLFSNFFKDSNDAKSQLYTFYSQKAYMLTSQNEVSVYTLSDDSPSNPQLRTGLQWSDFVADILDMFNVYQEDSVFQIIAGDILKAYGKEALISYPSIANDSRMEPVYDIHILTQIQNASVSATGNLIPKFIIPDNLDGFVKYELTEEIPQIDTTVADGNVIIPNVVTKVIDPIGINPTYNTNENVTDTGRLLSSTRLMVSRHGVDAPTVSDTGSIVYDTFGTEVVERMRIIVYAANETNAFNLRAYSLTLFPSNGRVGTNFTGESTIPAWSWFDYFPFVIPRLIDSVNNRIIYGCPLFDFNNFGVAYKSNLDSYNAIATISMLHKPFVSRVNKVEVFEN